MRRIGLQLFDLVLQMRLDFYTHISPGLPQLRRITRGYYYFTLSGYFLTLKVADKGSPVQSTG